MFCLTHINALMIHSTVDFIIPANALTFMLIRLRLISLCHRQVERSYGDEIPVRLMDLLLPREEGRLQARVVKVIQALRKSQDYPSSSFSWASPKRRCC